MMNENYNDDNYDYNDHISRIDKLGIIIGIVITVIIVFTVFSIARKCVYTYNSIISMKKEVECARDNVENMLQRRLELIPDLVSTIEAYNKDRKRLDTDIEKAQKVLEKSLDTGDLKQISKANRKLSIEVNSLVSFVKRYYDLTESEEYISLMDQLEGSVNRISIAREEYNEKVANYNNAIEQFPENILAGMFGFKKFEEFKADKAANNPNIVNFDD